MTAIADRQIFDAAALDRRTGGDDALKREIIGMFLEDCPTHLAGVRAAVGSGDAGALRRAAHGLKGPAAYVGGRQVSEAAADLEATGRDGRMADAPRQLEGLESAVAALLPLLR